MFMVHDLKPVGKHVAEDQLGIGILSAGRGCGLGRSASRYLPSSPAIRARRLVVESVSGWLSPSVLLLVD